MSLRRLKMAFVLSFWTFVGTLFPDWYWGKVRDSHPEYGVIKFPSKLVLNEVVEDGFVGLQVCEPWSYGLKFMYPQTSRCPRRRSLRDLFVTLSEFLEGDVIDYSTSITIKINFNQELNKQVKSHYVTISEESEDTGRDES